MERSRRVAVLLVLLFLVSLSQSVYSQSTGMTGRSVTGCTCHSNSPSLSGSISGLPFGAGGYTPGATYSLSWDGGPHVSGEGGFNFDVSAGSWTNLGAYVQLSNGELTHSSDLARAWTADWVAPAAGTGDVDFTLAVLYANGNGANSGDEWGTGAWTLGEASGSGDNPPVASNVTFVPTSPTKGTGLGVSYAYHDADGDAEQGTQIRWVVDGLNVGALNDQMTVANSWLTRGQVWYCTVTVKDGSVQGTPVEIGPVTIGNTFPVARNLEITPEAPEDSDELRLDYDYYDNDGDPQQQSLIRWYLDGARIAELDDSDRVSALMIRGGDQWEASVTPHDGDDYGTTVWTGIVVIGSSNNPPIATAYISPVGNARTDDVLQVHVGWSDPDGDSIQATEIIWYRDGTRYSAYNDMTYVLDQSTAKGETWMAKARVNDGLMWSEWVETAEVDILNTPPEVTSIAMLPEGSLNTAMDLSLVWEQSDLDGDAEMNSQIHWWVNGDWIREYDGWTSIPASETIRDQSWSVQVIPGDGDDLGSSMKTLSRLIENGAPTVPIIALGNGAVGYLGALDGLPEAPTTPADSLNPLVVLAHASDLDEEPILFSVAWERNGFVVPDLDDEVLVPAERLEPGQVWTVTVTVNDHWGLSESAEAEIEIINLKPTPAWTTEPEGAIPGTFTTFDGSSSSDSDGRVVSWLWLIDGIGYSGSSIAVQLGTGTHTITLTVIDNLGSSDSVSTNLGLGSVASINGLSAAISGSTVSLSWDWTGEETLFHIYRSTNPFVTSADSSGLGEPLMTTLTPTGETVETSWSETAPVATMLYYAVTIEIDGLEVMWLFEGMNTATVDATNAPASVDTDPTGSIGFMSLPLAIIMLLFALSSIGLSIYAQRRRDEW